MNSSIDKYAIQLDEAALHGKATSQISAEHSISLEESYKIQEASLERRYSRGEMLTGYKLGFTSKAKMEQMGVDEIIFGRLTEAMHILPMEPLQLNKYIHPRVEPEIAFLLGKDLDKKISIEEVPEYIKAVAVAIEVIDSRYENFKFSLEDVIADNCSSAGYMISEWMTADTSVQNIDISLRINKEEVQTGNSNAILGNPLESLVEVSKMAEKYNVSLESNHIILAGAATSAVYVKEGDSVEAEFKNLGTLSLYVT